VVNLWSFLSRAELLYPEREALVDGNRRFKYRELVVRIRRLAMQLAKLGVSKGTVVSMIAPNGVEFFETYYACAILGAILNPINTRLSTGEIAQILSDAGSSTLILSARRSETVADFCKANPSLELIIFFGGEPQVLPPLMSFNYDSLLKLGEQYSLDAFATTSSDLAQIYYTSGTTGKPKGVMLTHQNIVTHAISAIAELNLSANDVWLHAAPMFHLADAWATFAITAVGGKHVMLPVFDASNAVRLIQQEAITITNVIPTMVISMLKSEHLSKYEYKSLRLLLTGGAPISSELVKKLLDVFKCEYVQTYGLTETSPYLTLSLPANSNKTVDIDDYIVERSRTGRPFLPVELKVVHPDGTPVSPNDKEVGEIIVRGPTVTPGYWKQPEATAEAFSNGWFHTGDLAVLNGKGSINIVDRKKDVILTGGETVYSIEVENVLYTHPAVQECAVIGIPHALWGESLNAAVVRHADVEITETELIEYVRAKIAHYKAPRQVIFLDELPKTGSGKIWKQGIRDFCIERKGPEEATPDEPEKGPEATDDPTAGAKENVEKEESGLEVITNEDVSENKAPESISIIESSMIETASREKDATADDTIPRKLPKSEAAKTSSKRSVDLPFANRPRPES